MAATYAWHPGSNHVSPLWAVPIPLLPDEIFSSWLVRVALTQGCDPLVLTGEVWPKWRVWGQDVDRYISDIRLKPLLALSGISSESFRSATLQPIASHTYPDNLQDKAIWPWMLTLGARNTKRRSGLQYCPSCLAEDTKPYYRLQWRFAWHTVCEKHGCVLLDRCQQCNAPVEPHRLLAKDQNISLCATCKADMSQSNFNPCAASALIFQRLADHVAINGNGLFQGQTIDACQWFELAGFFVSLIRRASRSENENLNDFLRQLGVKLPDDLPLITGAGIELLRTHDRHALLVSVHPLMVVDQKQFESALKKSSITLQTFCGKGEALPMHLMKAASLLQDKPRNRRSKPPRKLTAPRPKHEVMRMMARLQRKLEMIKR